jgi:hypothetical protein
MMSEASIRPSKRNTLACNCGMSSGCRAAPSRNRLHMMPTPIQAPAAPSPIMRPIPIPVYAWIIANSCSLSTFASFLELRLEVIETNLVSFVRHDT